MMSSFKALFLTVLISASATTAVFASPTLPLTEKSAAELVQETGAKVLSVESENKEGKDIFNVKALHDDGKVKIYHLDATTGKEV